jgi:hypothetical protein
MIPLASTGYTLPFVGPGTYVIFGIVLLPVYLMLAAWFIGEPRDRMAQFLGVSYVVGITVGLWAGAFVATMAIKFLFF